MFEDIKSLKQNYIDFCSTTCLIFHTLWAISDTQLRMVSRSGDTERCCIDGTKTGTYVFQHETKLNFSDFFTWLPLAADRTDFDLTDWRWPETLVRWVSWRDVRLIDAWTRMWNTHDTSIPSLVTLVRFSHACNFGTITISLNFFLLLASTQLWS